MKPETLEALCIDQAMGELSAEASELLEAYLACDTSAAREAALVAEAVHLGRASVGGPASEQSPEVPTPGLITSIRTTPPTIAWRLPLAAAACLLFGLGLGWWAHPSAPAEPRNVFVRDLRLDEPSVSTTAFWNLENAASLHRRGMAAEMPAERRRLRWDSPVRRPQTEGNQ